IWLVFRQVTPNPCYQRAPSSITFSGRRMSQDRPEELDVSLNTAEGATMKTKISVGTFAALLITGSMFLQPAHAQSVPQGSYRTSCTDIQVEDRTLTAVCRIADGREQRTSLTDVNRCVGDIGNDNGALTCGHG